MSKKQSIFRSSTESGATSYTVLSNNILQSKSLTFDEVGLLGYLLSLPLDWDIKKYQILGVCKNRITKGRFDRAWTGLLEKGHILRYEIFSNNLKRDKWLVFETPQVEILQHRVSKNRESGESTLLESNIREINKLEIKELETITIGPNEISNESNEEAIVENKIATTGPAPISMFQAMKEQLAVSKELLSNATTHGPKILDYIDIKKPEAISSIIGPEEYSRIREILNRYVHTARALK